MLEICYGPSRPPADVLTTPEEAKAELERRRHDLPARAEKLLAEIRDMHEVGRLDGSNAKVMDTLTYLEMVGERLQRALQRGR